MLETSDVLVLARLQFAFTIAVHIIFPAISIGLASYCVVLEGLWLRTGKAVYRELLFFWSKIFAVGFGMGVVSGVVMAYEFGANKVRRAYTGHRWLRSFHIVVLAESLLLPDPNARI
jgi:Na+-driven multidrug efflux pump